MARQPAGADTAPKGRPPELFPVFGDLDGLKGLGKKRAQLLAKAGIATPRDLLYTLPSGGIDRRRRAGIRDVTPPETVTLEVTVTRHAAPLSRGRPWRVTVEDAAGHAFQLVFFHPRGDWIREKLPLGARRLVSGRLELFDGIAQMPHPDHILPLDEAARIPPFEPVYPLTQGITQSAMAAAVASALDRLPQLPEWIDPALRAREGWPTWSDALRAAHAPPDAAALGPEAPARTRLAYDELFAHQLTMALGRDRARRGKGRASVGTGALTARVRAALPYTPTGAQERAIAEISADLAAPHRMNRLLQGDVGAGKTLVALMALVLAVEAGGQGVLMAPTEILARQHRDALAPLAEAADVRLEVLTGRDRGAERAAKLAALEAGEIDILVGTHAVFSKDVAFRDLRLAVVDEQHRFGVAQRMELGAKGEAPDVLVMTATPIPRSLALSQYGHMDVSLLDEKPPGRLPVQTALVSMGRIAEVVEHLRRAVAEGQQAYWVCPLVEESELVDLTAAVARAEALRLGLGETVGLVHGQLSPAEKDTAMARFVAGETRVLVATTVIEVGVDVPAATIMVVERAETFGLAQLHQLRGRVGRGSGASTCLLLYEPPLDGTARRRLEIMRETEDGFRIAEEDLAIRGAGDLIGTVQSGLPRFQIANLERQAGLMARAQSDARTLLATDPRLTGERGRAARTLLWLLEQDRALALLSVG